MDGDTSAATGMTQSTGLFNTAGGHMEKSSMKLDAWLEVHRYSGLEIQLENLSTGLDVTAQGKGSDRQSRGQGPVP